MIERLREQGIEQRPLRSDELAPFNQVELVKWAALVKPVTRLVASAYPVRALHSRQHH